MWSNCQSMSDDSDWLPPGDAQADQWRRTLYVKLERIEKAILALMLPLYAVIGLLTYIAFRLSR